MRSKLVLLSSPTTLIVSKSSGFGSASYLGMAEADDQIGNPASASEGQREGDKEECTESNVPKEEQHGKHHGGNQPPHTSGSLPRVLHNVPYSEKLLRKKTFAIFRGFVAIRLIREIWRCEIF